MKFSLILASRDRVPLLKDLINSVKRTAKDLSQIEFIVVCDEDDESTKAFTDTEINLKLLVRQRSDHMHRDYINWAYSYSCGQFIIILNDDTLFINQNWDEADLTDVCYGYTETFSGEHLCCFPLLSREAINKLGFIMPNERRSWGADHDLYWIFKSPVVNKITKIPQIAIQHVSHLINTREKDNINSRMHALWEEGQIIPVDFYANRFAASFNKEVDKSFNKLAVHIIGLKIESNFIKINELLRRNYNVVVVGFLTDAYHKKIFHETFGTKISYLWFEEHLSVEDAVNFCIKKCVEISGEFEAYYYEGNLVNWENKEYRIHHAFFPKLINTARPFDHPKLTCISTGKNYHCILEQTFRDWELLIKADRVEVVDERVKYVTMNLQECLSAARGDLVVYLKGDDFYYTNAFSAFVNYFENNRECLVAYASIDLMDRKKICGEKRAVKFIDNCSSSNYPLEYLQVCHRNQVKPTWIDNPSADFHFSENIRRGENCGNIGVPNHPIDIKIGCKCV